jgi:hypothetical protein
VLLVGVVLFWSKITQPRGQRGSYVIEPCVGRDLSLSIYMYIYIYIHTSQGVSFSNFVK